MSRTPKAAPLTATPFKWGTRRFKRCLKKWTKTWGNCRSANASRFRRLSSMKSNGDESCRHLSRDQRKVPHLKLYRGVHLWLHLLFLLFLLFCLVACLTSSIMSINLAIYITYKNYSPLSFHTIPYERKKFLLQEVFAMPYPVLLIQICYNFLKH